MSVVFVFFVLWLGYLKSTSTPFGKAMLRRSQGWEAYAHLAKNGIEILAYGALISLLAVLSLYSLATLSYVLAWLLNIDIAPYRFLKEILSHDVYRGIKSFEVLIFLSSYLYYMGTLEIVKKSKKDKKEQNQEEEEEAESFISQDAILELVLEAVKTQSPLRVSLKSKKVYIGIIQTEQFERADLDNIVLIPYLSGHRDKDTLEMKIDHNYYSVYRSHGIFDDNYLDLSRFRVIIKLSEVESLSLFDTKYFSSFNNEKDGDDGQLNFDPW